MLISELKEMIKAYNEAELRLIIAEMYKSMPKKLREEKAIDTLLQNSEKYTKSSKIKDSKNEKVDVYALKPQIEQFVEYAYKQYYFAPNSMVHKKDRPKWRFVVKGYIKDLQRISIYGDEGDVSTELLFKLYEMLSYACGYYLFNTENPFRSIGMDQTELLYTVIARRFGSGINQEKVKAVLELVINSNVDRETVSSSLISVLIQNLKSSESKEMAIGQSKLLMKGFMNTNQTVLKMKPSTRYSAYERKEKINRLVEIVFRLNIELSEYDEAIQFYNKYYSELDAEITLYILLKWLEAYELKALWLREYDKAQKSGIKPRTYLSSVYEYVKENECFPERSANKI
ncbi:hypothetical protein [Fusibacter sp. 3D3]|uniref:hypothetical protein n=1 Tax=Fusibacter sp. 3D3 TaxID=1048380 RepID=UPI000852BF3B|nr:hypothetical protein [Fusibacter sp. 3D3]GAU78551.1 hypothetical protein F3D3_3185 [Fusibacter sp. 3D3]